MRFFQVIVITFSSDYTGVTNSPESFTPQDMLTYEQLINLQFLPLMSLSSLEETISISTRNLLLEMEHNQTVQQGMGEVMMLMGIITTNHCSQIPTTECFSGLLSLRYHYQPLLIIHDDCCNAKADSIK
ncbi:hypothetical protein OS493_023210 [Desmophyllum pertusum]|uniref:Uncharacterized protein n=1 Tax=Desmophyllum pertusum TaxID=174260 RepID=A0A9X0CL43_9CNID|nr:hypothetical protein OS493_023210 [Desmophyllum pertusum]